MKKYFLHCTIIVSIIFAIGIVFLTLESNLLYKSEETIRGELLVLTPIDTNMEDVVMAVKKKQWEMWLPREFGFSVWKGRPIDGNGEYQVGVKSIRVTLGSYYNI